MLLRGLIRGLLRGLKRGLGTTLGGRKVIGSSDISLLTAGANSTDGTSFSGATGPASIAPTSGRAIYVGVISHTAGTVESPVVDGNSLTWTAIASATQGQRRLTVYEGKGTPSAGAPSITFLGAQTAVAWAFLEVGNADTVDSVVQADTSATASAVTINATFPNPIENPHNLSLAFVGVAVATGVVADASFTELPGSDVAATSTTVGIEVQWAVDKATCDPTFSSSPAVIVMLEVRAG